MKKIMLISNYAFHYRLKIYNYLNEQFNKKGVQFCLLTEGQDNVDFNIEYPVIEEKQDIKKYISIIRQEKPDVVIIFLHLKDKVNFPISLYCKFKKIPIVVWTKGLNIKDANNKLKNQLYYFQHNIADAIVLYTPNEIKYVNKRNRDKVFFANNTLSFEGIDKDKVKSLEYVKSKYGIKQNSIVLFSATIKPDKRIDDLLDVPCVDENIAVVIAGKGISDDQRKKIELLPNYYYIGKVPYDDFEMNALFKAAKFFTTPGDLGLALIQAFFWGTPVVALDVEHSVEVYYLKNNFNGYLAANMKEFWSFISDLNNNEEKYEIFSKNSLQTYENQAHISNMFQGFFDAVKFALRQK